MSKLANWTLVHSKLSSEEQEVVDLLVHRELKTAQIAIHLGVSHRTAQRRISKAIGEFARHMEN